MSDLRETIFTWTIENFDMCPNLPGRRLESQIFSIDILKTSRFNLLLYPRGSKEGNSNYISLYLKRHNDGEADNLHLEYELCIIDVSGDCTNLQKSTYSFEKESVKGYSKFYERNLLLHSLRQRLFPENKLTVQCRLLPLKVGSNHVYMSSLSDSESLSHDFAELLKSGIHSDLTILVSGKEFKVHKAILEARCPTLTAQLVKVDDSNVMSLPCIDAPVLQALLTFVYTGIFCDTKKIDKVFVAANNYQLSDLKALLFPYSKCVKATTLVKVFQISFTWIIQNFETLQLNEEHPYFLISDETPKCSWMTISLWRTLSDDNSNGIFLKFQKIHKKSTKVNVIQIKVQAIDVNGEVYILKECEHMVFENGEWIISFNTEVNSAILNSGSLSLLFKIRTSLDTVNEDTQEISFCGEVQEVFNKTFTNWKRFEIDLRNFYNNMKFADLTLCIGSEKLQAHKAIICSRSQVFSKMFEMESLVKLTNSINIADIDQPTMASLLLYMYSGCTVLWYSGFSDEAMHVSKVIKLYAAAHKYQVIVLRDKCCQYLKSNMNAENVGDILLLVDEHYDENLKKAVYSFVTSNAKEVLLSERCLNVLKNRVDLYQEILNVLLRFIAFQN